MSAPTQELRTALTKPMMTLNVTNATSGSTTTATHALNVITRDASIVTRILTVSNVMKDSSLYRLRKEDSSATSPKESFTAKS